MRRQTSTAALLYNHLYPKPLASDPPNFSIHLARNLIPEIRVETAHFYGSLDSTEARYPGLNYCYRPHRMRLSRFPHHARLFRAIDDLGITDHEVQDLVRWEGTLWARARFERDEGIKVRDTTGDGIGSWVPKQRGQKRANGNTVGEVKISQALPLGEESNRRQVVESPFPEQLETADEDEEMSDEDDQEDADAVQPAPVEVEQSDEMEEEEDGDVGETIMSIGNDLNRRLLAAVTARNQGENVEMDPEFEQYLKEQIESGSLSNLIVASMQRRREQAQLLQQQVQQAQQDAAVNPSQQGRQGTAAA